MLVANFLEEPLSFKPVDVFGVRQMGKTFVVLFSFGHRIGAENKNPSELEARGCNLVYFGLFMLITTL